MRLSLSIYVNSSLESDNICQLLDYQTEATPKTDVNLAHFDHYCTQTFTALLIMIDSRHKEQQYSHSLQVHGQA